VCVGVCVWVWVCGCVGGGGGFGCVWVCVCGLSVCVCVCVGVECVYVWVCVCVCVCVCVISKTHEWGGPLGLSGHKVNAINRPKHYMYRCVCTIIANIGSTKICKIRFITCNVYCKYVTRNNNSNNNNIDMSDYQSVFVTHWYVHVVSLHAEVI